VVSTTLGCWLAASAPNAALVEAGIVLPSSIMAPANCRGSSGDEWPRSAMSPARLAEEASGSGRIVGRPPPSTLVQVTGSLATSAAVVAAAARTTGVEAMGSPTVTSGAVWPSDAAVAAIRSTQTLDSGTHASASMPPDAMTAAVSAESCALITVSTHASDAASYSLATSVSAGAIDVSATTTTCSVSAQPLSAAARSGDRCPPTQR
jgi:hypothetical protein